MHLRAGLSLEESLVETLQPEDGNVVCNHDGNVRLLSFADQLHVNVLFPQRFKRLLQKDRWCAAETRDEHRGEQSVRCEPAVQ